MTARHRIVAAAVAAVVGLGLGVVAAAPASAAASDCPNGQVCLWDDSNFNTMLVAVARTPGSCYNLPSNLNDRANGFYNRLLGGKHVQMYKDVNCTGPLLRNWGGSTGPFPVGEVSLFYHNTFANDQNRLTSIWFNTN